MARGELSADAVESRLAQSGVHGAAIAVVHRGRIDWAAGYGRRHRDHPAPVDPYTVFGAASVSKAIAALAIFGLAEDGLLDLDADIRPHLALPLVAHPILGITADEIPLISARMLLQHRGGIMGRGTTPKRDGSGFMAKQAGGGSRRFRQPVEDPAVLELEYSWFGRGNGFPVQLTYLPNSLKSYSGAGYLVLEHLLEQVTGRPFGAHLSDVMATYGATNCGFTLYPDTAENFASGHDEHGEPLPGGHELVPWMAAGGLYSDVISLAEILAGVLRDDEYVAGGQNFADFRSGSGVDSLVLRTGHTYFRRGGDNGGYRAQWSGFPATDDGVVVLTNGRATDGTTLRADLARMALPLNI